jgi:hypothetical protein
MSLSGINLVLQSCPLAVLYSSIPSCHFKDMVIAAPHLLCHIAPQQNGNVHLEESLNQDIRKAILACKGRVLFRAVGRGGSSDLNVGDLPNPVRNSQQKTKRILKILDSGIQKDYRNLEYHDRREEYLQL